MVFAWALSVLLLKTSLFFKLLSEEPWNWTSAPVPTRDVDPDPITNIRTSFTQRFSLYELSRHVIMSAAKSKKMRIIDDFVSKITLYLL